MKMNPTTETACIFPLLGLSEDMVRRVSSLFPRVVVCLPWYMEMPFRNGRKPEQPLLEVIRPACGLKPPEHFPELLKEYRTWMKDNLGRKASAFLAAARKMHLEGETRWDIQNMVRKGTMEGDVGYKSSLALKWHLLLHLAGAMEREQSEAEDALHRLRMQQSPLKDALGEDFVATDLIEDVPEELVHPIFGSDALKDICESWLGLFGAFVQGVQVLVTFDDGIKNYVRELFEETASKVDLIQPVPITHFRLPDPLTFFSHEPGIPGMQDLQKSVMLMIDRIRGAFWNRDGEKSDELDALIADMKNAFPAEDIRLIGVEVLSLPVVSGSRSSKTEMILNGLGGKTLAFVREVSNNNPIA
jgi:hypothetical protein